MQQLNKGIRKNIKYLTKYTRYNNFSEEESIIIALLIIRKFSKYITVSKQVASILNHLDDYVSIRKRLNNCYYGSQFY